MLRAPLLLAAAAATAATAAPLDSFLPPRASTYAAGADIVPAAPVPDASACAASCLASPACISINVCLNAGGALECGLSGWSEAYNQASAPECTYYRRSLPRNDTRVSQAVPWLLAVPAGGVVITGGPLADTFTGNVENYLRVRDPLDMLHFFGARAGQAPPGQCFGWDEWIKGSAAGNYLMGAGGALRWLANDTQLRANVETVVAGIAGYAQPNGWVWAFNETDIGADNLPDYCASWVTRGLLDAHSGGVPGALDLARTSISHFNNHSDLPFFLPQNGGPNPVQPFPAGFNNVTSGGYGQPYGHMIYIEWQGLPKHTLLALTEAGTQADVDISEQLYVEDWWLHALLSRDSFHAIWHRQFFSHNYANVAYESFVDLYVVTGNVTYLDAALAAWAMLRESWILPGGSFALNEGRYYPPNSYYIGFHGTHVAAKHAHGGHAHGGAEAESDDPYYHAPCMPGPGVEGAAANSSGAAYMSPLVALRQPAMAPPAHPEAGANPNDSDPPTGELCGSVFWTKLNQRFHRLFPENETFVGEMERSILNIGVAALGWPGSGGQGPNGTGIRYFANSAWAFPTPLCGPVRRAQPPTHPPTHLTPTPPSHTPRSGLQEAVPCHARLLLRGPGHAPVWLPARVHLHPAGPLPRPLHGAVPGPVRGLGHHLHRGLRGRPHHRHVDAGHRLALRHQRGPHTHPCAGHRVRPGPAHPAVGGRGLRARHAQWRALAAAGRARHLPAPGAHLGRGRQHHRAAAAHGLHRGALRGRLAAAALPALGVPVWPRADGGGGRLEQHAGRAGDAPARGRAPGPRGACAVAGAPGRRQPAALWGQRRARLDGAALL